jgi:hypothetical protein
MRHDVLGYNIYIIYMKQIFKTFFMGGWVGGGMGGGRVKPKIL